MLQHVSFSTNGNHPSPGTTATADAATPPAGARAFEVPNGGLLGLVVMSFVS